MLGVTGPVCLSLSGPVTWSCLLSVVRGWFVGCHLVLSGLSLSGPVTLSCLLNVVRGWFVGCHLVLSGLSLSGLSLGPVC